VTDSRATTPHDEGGLIEASIGKRLESVQLDEVANLLRVVFDDGGVIVLADRGQDCCETRYMTCDDDLQSFTGARLVGVEVADAPSIDAGGEVHEVQFLRVSTDAGTIVCETHNEHNGYYGGFNVCVEAA
jgi:hypothetical protein